MRAISRTVTMAIGLVGAVLGFVVSSFYSFFHVLGRVAGISADHGHFFIGLGVTLVGIVGAFLVLFSPEAGAVVMLLAAIGFFFVMGWWAIIPAVFLLVAAGLAFMSRRRSEARSPGGTAAA